MNNSNHIPPGYKQNPADDREKLQAIVGQPAGFKRIYGGLIPFGWQLIPLSKKANIEYGIGDPLDTSLRNGVKILSLPNVNKYGEFVLDEIPLVEKEKVHNEDYLRKGDLLFNWRNGSKEHLGKTAYFDLPGEYTHVGFLLRIRTDHNDLDPLYLKAYINFLRNNGFFLGAKIQVNNTFNKEELGDLPLMFPEPKEQTAIANLLSTWDKAIQTTTALIAQKEQRKKWLMQQLLTGKKRLKGFSGEWKEYSYEKLLKEVKRPIKWDDEELYHLISVRRRSGGIFSREHLYGHQIKVKDLRTANEGDFLFSKMQIVHGASTLVTKEFAGSKISGSYIAVVAKEDNVLNMEFFNWYSQTPYFYHQTYISSYGVHIEKMTFDFESFLSLEIKLPSNEEQAAIANVLQAADKELQILKAKSDALKEQKKGLMQQLLTGKKRLCGGSL